MVWDKMKTYRKFINEAKSDTAVFSFGRMNPPTIGHGKLIAKVVEVAKKERATPIIFPSKTEDKKKNPLSFKTKVKVLKDVFGNVISTDTSIKTPFDVLDKLNNDKYERVIFVVGSDRVNEFKRNMSRFVDSDLYNIKDFQLSQQEIVIQTLRVLLVCLVLKCETLLLRTSLASSRKDF